MKLFNGNITQYNTGDLEGTLFNSFNCDLSFNKGKLCIAPRTIITTNTVTDQGVATGFRYFDGYWWTTMGLYVWKAQYPQSNFTKDASNGGTYTTPNTCDDRYSDIETYNGKLIVTTTDRVYRKDADGSGTGGFDLIATGLSSSVVRVTRKYNNRLYWANTDNTIHSCDTSWAVSTTASASYNLTIPSNLKITSIRPHASGLFIGTISIDGSEGFVIDWNGETKNTIRSMYGAGSQGMLALYTDSTLVYGMNSNAEFMQFNGAKFVPIARLPLKRDELYNANAYGSVGSQRFIHHNGIDLIDGKICMLINNRLNTSADEYLDNVHPGIYEYYNDSLYHKYSLSYRTRPDAGGSITDYGQMNVINVGGLAATPDLIGVSAVTKGNFLCGASFYTNATTVGYGVWTDNFYDTVQKAGFFSTQQIRAEHFADMYNKMTTLYYPTTGFNLVPKYRVTRVDHIDFDITWTSETTFTTTQTGLVEGDEITIIRGTGSGRIAHISGTPTFSTPNFTVTLDEAITGVTTGTAKARREKWKKIGNIDNVNQFFAENGINNTSTLIEIKMAIVATGDIAIDELILDNKYNK